MLQTLERRRKYIGAILSDEHSFLGGDYMILVSRDEILSHFDGIPAVL